MKQAVSLARGSRPQAGSVPQDDGYVLGSPAAGRASVGWTLPGSMSGAHVLTAPEGSEARET